MVARNDAAQASLMAQLKARRVKKTYLALVQGAVAAAVGPDRGADRARPEGPQRGWPSSPTAGPPTTGYRVRERFAGWTLLELDLITGRTHQIRVHLAALGHPVAGDPVYGTGTSRRRPRRPRAAVPPRVAARARVAVDRRADPRRGAAAAELEAVLEGLRAGEARPGVDRGEGSA